jgi:hypothetical protein
VPNSFSGLFAGLPVTIPVEMSAIASLPPVYRGRTGRSGCCTIGIIIPRAGRAGRLGRSGTTAMTVPAAILAVIVATVCGRAAAVRLNRTGRDRGYHQHGNKKTERDHDPTIGRTCQKTVTSDIDNVMPQPRPPQRLACQPKPQIGERNPCLRCGIFAVVDPPDRL